jgi:hypothetical protein
MILYIRYWVVVKTIENVTNIIPVLQVREISLIEKAKVTDSTSRALNFKGRSCIEAKHTVREWIA